MNVDTPETESLNSFLAAVRRRLWAGELLDRARAMLWHIGLLLLILAGIHHLIVPVANTMTLLGVVILILLMLTRTLLRRPTVAASAAQADRAFNGHALMTTAVECIASPDIEGSSAAKIVLKQAHDAARTWRPKISKLVIPPNAVATELAIIPLFAGSVLLSLPGAKTSGDFAETTEADAAVTTGIQEAQSLVDTDDVATLRSVLADEELQHEESAVNERRDDTVKNLTPHQNAADAVASDVSELPQFGDVGAGVAGTSTDDNDLPGDAQSRKNQAAEAAPIPVPFQGRETIEIKRTGSIVTAGTNQNSTYADTELSRSVSPADVLAAAAPETGAHWASLTRAQSAYARRYLAESGKAND